MITAIDGVAVKDMNSLRKALLSYAVGDKAKLTVYRDGVKKEIDVELNIDSSNIDEFDKAQPSEDNKGSKDRLNPFFNLP